MDNLDRVKVGNLIRQRRKAQGMTLKDLAEKANVAYSYLSKIERGAHDVGLSVLNRVGSALNLDFGEKDKEQTIDLIKEVWTAQYLYLDGETIELTDEVANRMEMAIRMGFAWAKELQDPTEGKKKF